MTKTIFPHLFSRFVANGKNRPQNRKLLVSASAASPVDLLIKFGKKQINMVMQQEHQLIKKNNID